MNRSFQETARSRPRRPTPSAVRWTADRHPPRLARPTERLPELRSPLLPSQPNVDLPLDVRPLLGSSEPLKELLELRLVDGRKLKPGQEVKRLAQVASMVQAPGDLGQVLQSAG